MPSGFKGNGKFNKRQLGLTVIMIVLAFWARMFGHALGTWIWLTVCPARRVLQGAALPLPHPRSPAAGSDTANVQQSNATGARVGVSVTF